MDWVWKRANHAWFGKGLSCCISDYNSGETAHWLITLGGLPKWWYPPVIIHFKSRIFQSESSIFGYPHLWNPHMAMLDSPKKDQVWPTLIAITSHHPVCWWTLHLTIYLEMLKDVVRLPPEWLIMVDLNLWIWGFWGYPICTPTQKEMETGNHI